MHKRSARALVAEKKEDIQAVLDVLNQGRHFFISYDKGKEREAVRDIAKYNNHFLLLETAPIDILRHSHSVCLRYENIDLKSLFPGTSFLREDTVSIEYATQNEFAFENKIGENKISQYIYFYAVPDRSLRENQRRPYHYNIGKIMIQTLLKDCQFKDTLIVDGKIFLMFSSKNNASDVRGRDKYIIPIAGGIGDFFITFSIVMEALKSNQHKDLYIANRFRTTSDTLKEMFELCYAKEGASLLNLDDLNRYFWEYLTQHWGVTAMFEGVNNNYLLPKNDTDHIALLYKNTLLGQIPFDYYKHGDFLKSRILDAVSDDEKSYIDTLTKGKENLVGLQYFTGVFNPMQKHWSFFGDRKWNTSNVAAFIETCKAHNINLIPLNNESCEPDLEAFCSRKLSIAGYALLISKMDLVIGVDSSAGHIAAFYNIPSITLWGTGSPMQVHGKYHISYRPLRKNYSIIAKNADMSTIDSHAVFSVVKKYFDKALSFKDEIISYQDSVDDYHIASIR